MTRNRRTKPCHAQVARRSAAATGSGANLRPQEPGRSRRIFAVKRLGGARAFRRSWLLVGGVLLLAGRCPCCGQPACTNALGAAATLGGLWAGVAVVWRAVSSRVMLLRRRAPATTTRLREWETLYPGP